MNKIVYVDLYRMNSDEIHSFYEQLKQVLGEDVIVAPDYCRIKDASLEELISYRDFLNRIIEKEEKK